MDSQEVEQPLRNANIRAFMLRGFRKPSSISGLFQYHRKQRVGVFRLRTLLTRAGSRNSHEVHGKQEDEMAENAPQKHAQQHEEVSDREVIARYREKKARRFQGFLKDPVMAAQVLLDPLGMVSKFGLI